MGEGLPEGKRESDGEKRAVFDPGATITEASDAPYRASGLVHVVAHRRAKGGEADESAAG